MDVNNLLVEEFGRLPDLVREAVDGLVPEQLCSSPGEGANSVAWLVWHLTRIQDHHIAELRGSDQLYLADAWHERFGRGPDPQDHGYGHTADDVASVRPASGEELIGYYDAVHARTLDYLGGLSASDLDRIVDERWDPPVTLGVRLVSVLSDDLQHAGQAAYVHGLLTT
ncbi:MAG: DinB family protein [Acidimicrobiales bacterium]